MKLEIILSIVYAILSIVLIALVIVACVLFFVRVPARSKPTESPEEKTRKTAIEVAQMKCNEYVKVGCSNPIPKNITKTDGPIEIRGGTTVDEGMLPHMVFMMILFENAVAFCGGTLISEYYVMTAAHCLEDANVEDIHLKLGIADLLSHINGTNYTELDYFSPQTGLVRRVTEKTVHEGYNGLARPSFVNDIALLKLAKKVSFNWARRPICLNTNLNLNIGEGVTVSGWGLDDSGKRSTRLQILDQHISAISQSNCSASYITRYLRDMICVLSPTDEKNACQGDSGGPLQIPLKKEGVCPYTYEQIGVVSHGSVNCSIPPVHRSMYSAYTKVEFHIDWIATHVWPDEF